MRKKLTPAQAYRGPKPLVPPKPNVEEPPAWSQAVQSILYRAGLEADDAIVEEWEPGADPYRKLTLINDVIAQKLSDDPQFKRDYYDHVLFFIDRVKPDDGFSRKGASVDRAEARLWLWFKLFE